MTEEQKTQIINLRDEGYSYGEIASALNISVNTVKSFCRRNDKAKEDKENLEEEQYDNCKYCGRKLEKNHRGKPKKFCSEKCRREWWKENKDKHEKKAFYTLTCQGCGIEFQSYGNKDRKFCTHACYIKHRFKGGDTIDKGAIWKREKLSSISFSCKEYARGESYRS